MKRIHERIFNYRECNRVAIVDTEGNSITYSEIFNSSVELATEIEVRQSSKKVVLYTGNAIEYAIGLLAIWMTNRTAVLVESKTKQEEVNVILQYFNCDTIIYSHLTCVEKVKCKNTILPVKICEKRNCWEDKPFTNDIAMIFQTSGTTQQPKYVTISHSGIIEQCDEIARAHKFGVNTRELLVVPITSSFGTCGVLLPNLCVGGGISLYQGNFNTAKLRRFIKETKVTIVACTSSILTLLIGNDYSKIQDFDSVRYVISAGEVSNVGIFERVKSVLGAENIVQAYGLTETSSQIAGSCVDPNAPYESVGRVLKNFSVRIKEGEVIRANNELGEIQVKGNAVTCGYYGNPELNHKAFEEGWFRTGDIGYIDDAGYLYITGRIKNIIIVGGVNVYPEEVEKILTKNENILFASVYGQKSSVTGERVVCELIFKEGANMSVGELNEYCRKNMKAYMVPKEFIVINDYKINTSGKAPRVR